MDNFKINQQLNIEKRLGAEAAAALFEHVMARPDKTFKIATPQLHTHASIFNVTETENGITKPIQPLEIYNLRLEKPQA